MPRRRAGGILVPMHRSASMSAVVLTVSLLLGCGARAALDVSREDGSNSGSTATSGGLGGGGATATTTSGGLGGTGAGPSTGGAGGGLFELGTFDEPVELALDGEYVYVSVRGSADGAGQVVKVPKSGGASITLVSGLTKTGHLAVDAASVFYMHHPKQKYQLTSVSKLGGATKDLTQSFDTCWLAADAENIYCARPMSTPLSVIDKVTGAVKNINNYGSLPVVPTNGRAVLLDDASVFLAVPLSLLKMSKSDEVFVELVDTIVNVQRLAQDTTQVYWTTPGWPAALGSVSKEGGEPVWLGEDVEAGTRSLAVYDADVYWTNDIEGTIKRVPKDGGATTVVASGQARPGAMVGDASGVYWVNQDDGRVMRFVP